MWDNILKPFFCIISLEFPDILSNNGKILGVAASNIWTCASSPLIILLNVRKTEVISVSKSWYKRGLIDFLYFSFSPSSALGEVVNSKFISLDDLALEEGS
eukprot:Awhi_evm3s373